MKNFLSQLAKLTDTNLIPQNLKRFLSSINFQEIVDETHVPKQTSKENYARNILMLEPIEVVVLNWPEGVESAIHHHEGFWGYVYVLEGSCENVTYRYQDKKLLEDEKALGMPGALIYEEDGVIHKLRNPSKNKRAVTVHIYFPPLQNFDGMKIFETEKKWIGELNENAKTSSWEEPTSSFHHIQKNAFEFIPYSKKVRSSHHIATVIPKPSQKEIGQMLEDYYNEQAAEYDYFDTAHHSRKAYNEKINVLIALDFEAQQVDKILALACGTGRRAVEIRHKTGINYQIIGVDLSCNMLDIAEERGLTVLCSDWLNADLEQANFDAATFLYSFGHISTHQLRKQSLLKIADHLRKGGALYLDVFNLDDKNEWGPKSLKYFDDHNLANFGYDEGDVFYKKAGGNAYAFLHYFKHHEIKTLLEDCGFKVAWIKYIGYVNKPGEIFHKKDEGALFIKAIKE